MKGQKKIEILFLLLVDFIISQCFGVSTMSSIIQNLSLFIPYVFLSITEVRIAYVFENNQLGIVDHVDFVRKTDKFGKSYNSAYVHFSQWFNNSMVENFQERVLNPTKDARIVYDDPWFWIVLQNTGTKFVKDQETAIVSSDYTSILQDKLAATEKCLEELKERVSYLENNGHEKVMRVLARREQNLWGSDTEDYDDMPPLIPFDDEDC